MSPGPDHRGVTGAGLIGLVLAMAVVLLVSYWVLAASVPTGNEGRTDAPQDQVGGVEATVPDNTAAETAAASLARELDALARLEGADGRDRTVADRAAADAPGAVRVTVAPDFATSGAITVAAEGGTACVTVGLDGTSAVSAGSC